MAYRDPVVTQERVRRLVRRRRRARRAKIASIVLSVLIVAGAAAIGVDRGVVFARHLWDEHHRHHPTEHIAARPKATTTTTIPGPPRCNNTQISAFLYHWLITGGTLYEEVALANVSSAPCTLAGYVSLSVGAPGGGTIPAAVHDDATLGALAGASTSPVAVAAGQRVWFEVSYPVECSTVLAPGQSPTGSAGECYQGATFGVVLPEATAPLDVPQPLGFTFGTAGFVVGPFASDTPPPSPPVS